MTPRPVHRLTLRNRETKRDLFLEPWGMWIALAIDDEVTIELIGVDPPELEIERDQMTLWHGVGSEIRVLRAGEQIYSTVGIPVPDVPPSMSVQGFLGLVGAGKPRRG
jgi:hypothetical protein